MVLEEANNADFQRCGRNMNVIAYHLQMCGLQKIQLKKRKLCTSTGLKIYLLSWLEIIGNIRNAISEKSLQIYTSSYNLFLNFIIRFLISASTFHLFGVTILTSPVFIRFFDFSMFLKFSLEIALRLGTT